LAALTGYRIHDGERERRRRGREKPTAHQHEHSDPLPHLILLPLAKELFGPFFET